MVEEIETVAEGEAEESAEPEVTVAELKEALAAREGELASLKEHLALAVSRYRELVLAGSPEIPGELVAGATVDEVDASLHRATEMVERVRRQLEAQRAQERVPAGAPARTPPDLSGLSPREKIAYALGRQQR